MSTINSRTPRAIKGIVSISSEQEFNAKYPIGSTVNYHPVINQPEHFEVEIRSTAWRTPSGHIVVRIKGRSGYVSIEAIRPIDADGVGEINAAAGHEEEAAK